MISRLPVSARIALPSQVVSLIMVAAAIPVAIADGSWAESRSQHPSDTMAAAQVAANVPRDHRTAAQKFVQVPAASRPVTVTSAPLDLSRLQPNAFGDWDETPF